MLKDTLQLTEICIMSCNQTAERCQ